MWVLTFFKNVQHEVQRFHKRLCECDIISEIHISDVQVLLHFKQQIVNTRHISSFCDAHLTLLLAKNI